MTPNELYARNPETTSKDLNLLRGYYYNHIPEVDDDVILWFDEGVISTNEKIEIKIYKDFDFDGRRFWRLASVWFEGRPVMIIQNAGREGDDYIARIVTDEPVYRAMIEYIFSILLPSKKVMEDLVDPNEDIKGLTNFYGNSLDGVFERYY